MAPIWGRTLDDVLDNLDAFFARLGGALLPRPGRSAVVERTAKGVVLVNARVSFPEGFLDVRAVVMPDGGVAEYSFHVQRGHERLAGLHLDATHGFHTHDPTDWSIRLSGESATFDLMIGLVRGLLGVKEPEA